MDATAAIFGAGRATSGARSHRHAARRGAVSVLFAAMAVPLVLTTGLAVDYSFYVQAESQLSTAADAAAMHAVRVASAQLVSGRTLVQSIAAGNAASQQWWDAQLGTIADASVKGSGVSTQNVQYSAATGTFTDTVSFTGTVATHVGRGLTGVLAWPIVGSAGASISSSSYSEIDMLVDNSSSMLIGATPADIIALENLTICPPTATALAAAQNLSAYSWQYPGGIGYGWGQAVPTKAAVVGQCDANFTGGAAQCPYPQSMPTVNANGFCPAGTGIADPVGRIDPATHQIANIPQAPCGFACHTGDGVNDYYTLARNQGAGKITLRFDVIQAAMANVVNLVHSKEQIPNQFTVGVFQFNSGVTQVHPASGGVFTEADPYLVPSDGPVNALTDIANIATPVVPDAPNTNFPGAISYLAANLSPAGDGTGPGKRKKNIFIVTDGLEDYSPWARFIGPMTNTSPETYCAQLKTLGFNVYVLYTPFYPLPNEFYLNNGPRSAVEPVSPPAASNPVIAALQACASLPTQFYQAGDAAGINLAMQQMVQSAIASPGRITN